MFQSIDDSFSLHTDRLYIAQSVLLLETCRTFYVNTSVGSLFLKIHSFIVVRKKSIFFVSHVRSHSNLPGPLAHGNDVIDQALTGEVFQTDPVVLAQQDHNKFHLSSHTLRLCHNITKEQA